MLERFASSDKSLERFIKGQYRLFSYIMTTLFFSLLIKKPEETVFWQKLIFDSF